jgi:alkaline phosphatase
MNRCVWSTALAAVSFSVSLMAQSSPSVRIVLPERPRLLQGQLIDLVVEVRNAASVSNLKVVAGGVDLTAKFGAPAKADLDCDSSSDWVMRANLQSFETPGDIKLDVSITAGTAAVADSRTILVREFNPPSGRRRNIVLFIGDAMGTAYRDAARLVSRSIVDASGKNSFRDGFFDDLLEVDKMPVSGMSMTYGTDSIVPDSANTGTAWATGNKSFLNAVNSLGDGTDCKWRFNGQQNAATMPFITDNPRVENLWQYLKRRFGYRTGIVSTAAITDATPAVEGAYVGYRQARLEIARQYLENPMLNGRPAFDVILGGGADPFTAAGRTDKRNLIAEFQALGYRYVTNASELRGVNFGQSTLGLFKGSAAPRSREQRHCHRVGRQYGRGVRQAETAASRLRTHRQPRVIHRSADAGPHDAEGYRRPQHRLRRAPVHSDGGRRVDRQAVASQSGRGHHLGHHRV